MLSERAQVKNKKVRAATPKPAPIERSQTVAQVKASRAWARAGNLRASAAEPIPAELRPGPKQALCILPMIRREEWSEHNHPVAARIRWRDPRTDGATRISTEAIHGHSGDRRRAHHHLRLDSDGHHGGHRRYRRVHRGNHDRHREGGGFRGDSRSEDDSRGADCSLGLRCPTERGCLLRHPIPRALQRAWEPQVRSMRAAPTPHPMARLRERLERRR